MLVSWERGCTSAEREDVLTARHRPHVGTALQQNRRRGALLGPNTRPPGGTGCPCGRHGGADRQPLEARLQPTVSVGACTHVFISPAGLCGSASVSGSRRNSSKLGHRQPAVSTSSRAAPLREPRAAGPPCARAPPCTPGCAGPWREPGRGRVQAGRGSSGRRGQPAALHTLAAAEPPAARGRQRPSHPRTRRRGGSGSDSCGGTAAPHRPARAVTPDRAARGSRPAAGRPVPRLPHPAPCYWDEEGAQALTSQPTSPAPGAHLPRSRRPRSPRGR